MLHRNCVDLFCGAGGMSSGLLQAARQRRVKLDLVAVNHWDTAINSHSLNHPQIRHLCEPVENLIPAKVIPSRRLWLLAAGCECTFHSNARGGGPCNEQSRSQAWQLIRWATDIEVDNILLENVREFMHWGPLHPCTCGSKNPREHRQGFRCFRPIEERKGEFFNAFLAALRGLGYAVEHRLQCAADYGDPTSRVRFLLIARKHQPIVWPQPTHCDPAQLKLGRKLKPWRTAREIIDWSLPGTSIFGRKKPLCANTLARIEAGLRKFGGDQAAPFLVVLRGTHRTALQTTTASVDEPLTTISAGGRHHCLVQPFVLGQQSCAAARCVDDPLPTVATAGAIRLVEPFLYHANHGADKRKRGRTDRRVHSLDTPLPTVTTKRGLGLCAPILVQTDQTGGNGLYARSVDRPLPTVVSKQNQLLVQPLIQKFYGTGVCQPVSKPLDTVTTKDRFMLVEFKGSTRAPRVGLRAPRQRQLVRVDILTRMLQPHELKAAHSFGPDYQLTGTKEDQTTQIGNSVPVQLAAAHGRVLL